MAKRPPWGWIAFIGALLLLPGPTLRLLFGVAQGLTLLFLLVPLVGSVAAWIWWRRLQSSVVTCPRCGTLTMQASRCPACGYGLDGADGADTTPGMPTSRAGDVIDVQASSVDD
ncbi:MAG: hypothetical protein ERJ67_00210 [Aphanocapsa feldmannii 277cV]|uniref:Uncharacterized protein n=2 Tax=Aphanocapsa feldmannii TaxID=192050 RepID=A0A524RS89_9CHRO|nr:MAG: hypothetical protein ERJ67_00210 [Aphanocapsa feldmannii 277cV]TGH18173.1 MAG: hypothetical protein ERJ68_09285 [Aphanocapsa feldmannii 277cI]